MQNIGLVSVDGRPVNITTPRYMRKLEGAGDAMQKLRYAMHGIPPRQIAEDIGVSVSTIYAVKSGRTKWPRPATFFGLVEYFGFELVLVKARQEDRKSRTTE